MIIDFLKKCRDFYCSICVHHIIISCDDSFYNWIKKVKKPFQNFIFEHPSSFSFLSSIIIKYLSSYNIIFGENLQTSW